MIRKRSTLIFIAAALIAFLVAVIGTYNALTRPYPGLNDFMSRWEGARSYWIDGLNPYGEAASFNIQRQIYGRAALEDEDPGFFAYPFYIALVIWPLVHFDYAWASAVWMVLLEACLLLALILLLDLFRWRPRPLLLAVLVLWSLFSYFPSRGLILGQPGVLVYLLEILAVWALSRQQDRLAGIALALSTIKPQMGYLIVPFLLLWSLREKRWQFAAAFIITFGGLMIGSFVLLPSWLADWLAQVRIYDTYTALGSPIWIIVVYYLNLGEAPLRLIELACYGLLLWQVYETLFRGKRERLLWTITLALTITHLVAPRTATPHYVVFMIPLIFALREMIAANRRAGGGWALLLLTALFIVQWIHFLTTVQGEFEHPTIYLPWPLLSLAYLWITRRRWWGDVRSRSVTLKDQQG